MESAQDIGDTFTRHRASGAVRLVNHHGPECLMQQIFAQWLVAPVMTLILYYREDKSDVLLQRKKRRKRGRNKPVHGKTTEAILLLLSHRGTHEPG